MFYAENGQVTGCTYFQKLQQNSKSNTKLLKTFEKNLLNVLEELKNYKSISQFSIGKNICTPNGKNEKIVYQEEKITTKNYKSRDLQIHIKL